MKAMGLIIVSIVTLAMGFSETQDTTQKPDSISPAQLMKKYNELEAKLERFKAELLDENPLANAGYLQWGKGWTILIQPGLVSQEFQAGYIFHKFKKMRFGLLAGGYYRIQGFNYGDYMPQKYGSIGALLGTPVFLNMIDFYGEYRALYLINNSFCGGINSRFGNGFNADVEFWVLPNTSISFGNSAYIFRRNTATEPSALVGPFMLYDYSHFGFHYYFRSLNKKPSENRKP